MSAVSRRDAVKVAAGLAVGATAVAPAPGREVDKTADPDRVAALDALNTHMFYEQVTFRVSTTDPHTFDLVIGPARGKNGRDKVIVRHGPGFPRRHRPG